MGKTVFIWGKQGNYTKYREAICEAGGQSCLSERQEDAKACDALLLPGGGDLEPWRYGQENIASRGLEPARDEAELALIQRFLEQKKPILGICRGLQTINVFFGGTLAQDLPGHSAVEGTDRFHAIHTAPSPFRTLYGAETIVNSAHHQAVDRLGSGLEAIQWAEDGVVEAVYHRKCPVWAVQWHPERLRGRQTPLGSAKGEHLFSAFFAWCAVP